jgi:glyoxalase family protein
LRARRIAAAPVELPFGERALSCSDPSGLAFDLVASDDRREPWTGVVGSDLAIRGLHSVTLTVRDPGPTVSLMEEFLGWKVAGRDQNRTRVDVAGGGPGKTIDIVRAPDAEPAVNGLGTVHHVAMAIARADDQALLREELLARGVKVTDIRDRCYFNSIYFREPGGVLFEVATVAPGFTVDEDVSSLGTALKLPPWEEANRADIEKHIGPVNPAIG